MRLRVLFVGMEWREAICSEAKRSEAKVGQPTQQPSCSLVRGGGGRD